MMKKILVILIFLVTLISQVWGDTEPNDSCAQAETWTTLTARGQSSSTMSGDVSSSNQNDYYKIVLTTSGSLQISGSSNQNTNYYILNSACTQLTSQTNTKTPNLAYTAAAGTYYLRINRNATSTYSNMKATLGYIDGERAFSSIYSSNTRGGVKIIGNSNLCKTNSSGVCIEPDTGDNNDGTAERSANKISFTDLDGDGTTFNSTSANLNLPVGSKIIFAKLYWQGYQDKRSNPINQIKFKKSGNSYQTVTATQTDTLNSGDNYQSSIDITNLVDVNNPNGTYYVANIAADVYADNTTQDVDDYAAWTLFVVYENPSESLKNITLWDGYDSITSGSTTITASGFRTPLTGAINSSFLIFSTEGDVQSTGDYIQVNGTNLTNGSNPSNNPFNSTISSGGVNVTARNPNYANTLGIDVDDFNVSSLLGNNQTSATIRIGTSGDGFYVSAFAFSTDIYSPAIGNFDKNVSVTYASNQTCGTDKDLRGATLNYEMTFENTGSEAASNVNVYDDFQSNGILDYLDMTQTSTPTAQLLSGTAASTITCDKNATAVYCNFNRINIGTKYKITFSTKVKNSLIIADDITLSNTANAHYYNASTGEEITQIASSNMKVAGGICAVLPVANYRFDECSASGLQGDTLDSSGNNLNGMTVNSPFKVSGQICMGNRFSRNTYSNITVPHNSLLSQLNELSITAWINPLTIPSSDLYTIVSKDTNYEFHINTSGQIFWWWSNATLTGTSTIPTNTWSHVAITYKDGEQHVYINGVEDAASTNTGTLPQNTLPLYIGVDYNYPSRTFDGTIDEVKIFDRSLSQSEVLKIYTNELSGNNFNSTIRTCPDCAVTPDPAITFDAWDSFRSISDRNISTKIVNKPFDLTIASINGTNDGYQDFNGTLCARLIDNAGNTLTDWVKLTYASEQTKTASFILNRAIGGNDNAGVRLLWEKNALAATACDALTATDTTTASDRFAVRPASFGLFTTNAVAGTDFYVDFIGYNYNGSASADYNETSGGTFDVSTAEHNAACPLGTFTIPLTPFSFQDGIKSIMTRYSDVGIIDINITDLTKPCTSRFAKIDCDDLNVSDGTNYTANLISIGLEEGTITITPHHFDVNATLSNFSGGTFTYLSDDLNMSAQLDLNITAKNGEGNTTTNYSSACYAKNINLTLDHSTVPSPLTKILYTETLSTLNTTVLKDDSWVLSLNSTLFNSGSVAPNIDFNFDRSPTKPLNPFDFNITSATAADVDITGSTTPLGDTTFVYGRVHAYDITTNTSPVNAPIEFEVYSTLSSGFVSGMPQNVLKWYRNLDHDTAAHGNVILGGFNAGATDSAIVTSASPADGLQLIGVTSIIDQTVHLKISPWLWYSLNPLKTYNYGTDCTQHPCFNYDYTDVSAGVQGVNSGTFQGSDFQMTPAKNITNKGVKLFR